jgi:hypothetical protein
MHFPTFNVKSLIKWTHCMIPTNFWWRHGHTENLSNNLAAKLQKNKLSFYKGSLFYIKVLESVSFFLGGKKCPDS